MEAIFCLFFSSPCWAKCQACYSLDPEMLFRSPVSLLVSNLLSLHARKSPPDSRSIESLSPSSLLALFFCASNFDRVTAVTARSKDCKAWNSSSHTKGQNRRRSAISREDGEEWDRRKGEEETHEVLLDDVKASHACYDLKTLIIF